jgi:neutral ceramidase
MSLRAGFAEIEITPPVGTLKAGWIVEIVSEYVLDPLHARAALFESGGERLAFVQLDLLSIRWTQVNDIRRRVEARYGFPGRNIMVSATHTHAGPATGRAGDVRRDDAYVETLVERVGEVFGQALERREEVEVGFGSVFEFEVAHNRRVVMRDGTVRTHGTFDHQDALCLEGPIDPEVAVIAARNRQGELPGALVNFACHPTHHGPDGAFSAGFPGVLAAEMKARGCPVTLFLNGAAGNMHTADPYRGGRDMPMEEAGRCLAVDTARAIEEMAFRNELRLASRSRTLQLPYREITEAEVQGTARGAQRFVDPAAYDRSIPALVERIRQRGSQPAEAQVHFLDEWAVAALPGECFVEIGLRIKERAWPRRALVIAYANGMVGYVPHREAFARGGYETTFTDSSRLAPQAGEMLADGAVALIREKVTEDV